YDAEIDWYIRPVLDGPNWELRFWWWHTRVWVGNGIKAGRVFDKLAPAIFAMDIQQRLRDGVVNGATQLGCPDCLDGKSRLQMSCLSDDQALNDAVVWWESFEMERTHPKMVLNLTRQAD